MNANMFQTLVETSLQGVLVHRNFKPLFTNRAYAQMFGYESIEDVLRLPSVLPLIQDDEQARAVASYHETMNGTPKATQCRFRKQRCDGSPLIVDMCVHPIPWDGQPAMLMTTIDVTDLVSAQDRVGQALAQTAAHLMALLDAVPTGVCLFDERLHVVAYNQRFATICQYPDDLLQKRPRLRELVEHHVSNGLRCDGDPDKIVMETITRWERGELDEELILDDGRVIEVAGTRRPNEGWLFIYKDITDRKRMEADLYRLATTDFLTGVSNRRSLIDRATHEVRRAQRLGSPISLLLLDVDRFKAINDVHGHATGDAALISLCQIVRQKIRRTDLLGRWGGEEFCILLPDTDLTGAAQVAEMLRECIDVHRLSVGDGSLQFTVSIGVAVMKGTDDTFESILGRADAALYSAKSLGRNRVVTSAAL